MILLDMAMQKQWVLPLAVAALGPKLAEVVVKVKTSHQVRKQVAATGGAREGWLQVLGGSKQVEAEPSGLADIWGRETPEKGQDQNPDSDKVTQNERASLES